MRSSLQILLTILCVVVCMQLFIFIFSPRYLHRGRIDAVVIPGGGVRADGRPPRHVQARLDAAASMPKDMYRFMITLSAGTPHRPPPLDANQKPILESRAAAQYLLHGPI